LELDKGTLAYDLFYHKKVNGMIDSWVAESCFGSYKPLKKKKKSNKKKKNKNKNKIEAQN
jgi:hypothetical protein